MTRDTIHPLDSQQQVIYERFIDRIDSLGVDSLLRDSLLGQAAEALAAGADSISGIFPGDTMPPRSDTVRRRSSMVLDDVIKGKNVDSMIYDLKRNQVMIFNKGEVEYQDKSIAADFIRMDMNSRLVYAQGMPDDSTGLDTHPVFKDGTAEYVMDTLYYNMKTEKARIRGVVTREGEGIMRGSIVKKMPDNTINMLGGEYTTCDADHPHFYLQMTKAKVLPGKKAVFNYSYLVMEDVPIYFLALPFGFFPVAQDNSSGFIIPTFGEEVRRGFFLRDGGYYFVPNDYMDARITGELYTLGSWGVNVGSRYLKRYRFNGNLNINYNRESYGDKGSKDYQNMNNFRIQWTHAQVPNPSGSTFSANVNFSSSGYGKYSGTSLNDMLNSNTSSSIAYSTRSRSGLFSLSSSLSASQDTRSKQMSFGLPVNASVSRFFPFKRRNAAGRERWYEKIAMTYTGNFNSSLSGGDSVVFKPVYVKDNLRASVTHAIPVSTSFNILNIINFSPSFNYNENWYFDKVDKAWDPATNRVAIDTLRGFYRVFSYNYGASASTKLYGMYDFVKPNSAVRAVRHVITPTVGVSVSPSFGGDSYGYWKTVQTDSTGTIQHYSPYEGKTVPGRGSSASLSYGLGNTFEMKVRSDKDSTGVRKVSILDNLSFSGSYDLLADSLNFSPVSVNIRSSIIKDFAINLSMVYSLYQVDPKTGQKINKFLIEEGKLARLESVGTSFGYNFKIGGKAAGQPGAINTGPNLGYDPWAYDPANPDPPAPGERRAAMSGLYYDFSVPLNFGFNYSVNYTNNGVRSNVSQTVNFNFSTNLTPKWGITMSQLGYDFASKRLTPGQFVLTRDLHCWQMNFTWIPFGTMKSWSFNISVKSGALRDLKYDKSRNYRDIW
ncbi:MAG: LPS-assembly protein LptD [Rikenellaceae bacterium]|nr:LPS-assembly protein LptD [Rikenellaceae bacterium]